MSSILLGKLGTATMSLNCLLQTLRKSSIILHLIRTPLNESTLLAPLLLYFFFCLRGNLKQEWVKLVAASGKSKGRASIA